MRTFAYRARTADGMEIKGRIAAESAPVAVRKLADEGQVVVHMEERWEFRPLVSLQLRRRITAEERIAFFHELTALLGAGLPIHEALTRLLDGGERVSAYGRLVAALHQAVTRGTSLSQAMEAHPTAFSPGLVGMVRAGEESGTLAVVLHEAAAFLTEGNVMRESLRSALAYPLFLLAATVFSVLLMTAFVLPIFAALLRDLHAELPLPTRVLLALSDTAVGQPYLIPFVLVVLCGILMALVRVPSLRLYADGFLLRIPVLGTFLRFSAWRMISRTLAILLHSGIRLDRAVGLVRVVTENRALARSLERTEQALVQGRTFAAAMEQNPYLPSLLRGMLAAGEAAGDLEHLLNQAADYCQRRAMQYAARIEALAEPVMIVFIGFLIFFTVLSFLLPIFDAMDALM